MNNILAILNIAILVLTKLLRFLTSYDCSALFSLQKTFVLQRLSDDSSSGSSALATRTELAVDFPQTLQHGVPVVPVAHHRHQEEGEEHGNAANVEEVIVMDCFD